MADARADLLGELRRLRKGRAVHSPRVHELAGPALRELCGVGRADGPAEVRRKLVERLTSLAAGLPEDLRLALLVAFALHPRAEHPLLKQRLGWLAGQLVRDERTARRRVEDACLRVAELADRPSGSARSAGGDPAGDGWYLALFAALVRLDTPTPQVRERRRIVATRNGLTRIVPSISLPRCGGRAHELDAKVLQGGRLVRRRRPSASLFQFVIELPSPLHTGETHEYGLLLQVPPGQPMVPHYVLVPHRRCDEFLLRVRFAPNRMPSAVWRVDAAPIRVVDDETPPAKTLVPDTAGEVHARFADLVQGRGYGIQWTF
jgi:hypothetical protein